MTISLILLDRDGVINEDSDAYIKSPEEWIPIPGSLEAIARLHGAGLRIGICSNQSGVARGLFTQEVLEDIHRHLCAAVTAAGGAIQSLRYCPHLPDGGCACRKPEPGMLVESCRALQVPATETCFIGDSARDIEAARNAGCIPILVRTGNGRTTESGLTEPVAVFDDLAAAAEAILSGKNLTEAGRT